MVIRNPLGLISKVCTLMTRESSLVPIVSKYNTLSIFVSETSSQVHSPSTHTESVCLPSTSRNDIDEADGFLDIPILVCDSDSE